MKKWSPTVRPLIVLSMVLLAGIVACAGDPALALVGLAVWALAVIEGGW